MKASVASYNSQVATYFMVFVSTESTASVLCVASQRNVGYTNLPPPLQSYVLDAVREEKQVKYTNQGLNLESKSVVTSCFAPSWLD